MVLGGGGSRRMGRPKADLIDATGRPLMATALHRLWPWARVRVVAGQGPGQRPPPWVPWLRDPPGLCGPLAGVAAAVQAFPADYYLVLALDLPRARPDLLVDAGRRHPDRAVVGRTAEGAWQPLAGLYPAEHARGALRLLRRGQRRAISWALSGPRVPFAVPGPWWVNVNTPEEAARLLGPPYREPAP
ncbi:molybdenum cofactor guanylyltransferase [Thiohalorhabdus sp.]|uniref:molybdenum cofactor guanylyltransferase n=1 Tax=Thiohalorhabdus sp. TaxID=3094134 RepID=UPI002FC29C3C